MSNIYKENPEEQFFFQQQNNAQRDGSSTNEELQLNRPIPIASIKDILVKCGEVKELMNSHYLNVAQTYRLRLYSDINVRFFFFQDSQEAKIATNGISLDGLSLI